MPFDTLTPADGVASDRPLAPTGGTREERARKPSTTAPSLLKCRGQDPTPRGKRRAPSVFDTGRAALLRLGAAFERTTRVWDASASRDPLAGSDPSWHVDGWFLIKCITSDQPDYLRSATDTEMTA
ncbi:hypothetical protein MRX96_038754 [Rhipicephalus microplus]